MGPLFQSRAPAALLGDKNVLRRYWECPGTDPLSPFRCFDCPPPPPSSPYSILLQPATVYSPTAPNTTCPVPGLGVEYPHPPPGCFTLHALAFHPGEPLLGRAPHISPPPLQPSPLNPPYSPLFPPTRTAGGEGDDQTGLMKA